MVKEVSTIIYTAFPNLDECDTDDRLVGYLEEKMRQSRLRIFDHVITKKADPFHPYDNMIRMPAIEFNDLCSLLGNYRSARRWWWSIFQISDQEEIIDRLKKIRDPYHSAASVNTEGAKHGFQDV